MNASFCNLIWQKGQPAHLQQGVNGNRRPKGAIYGGNGSFMVAETPTSLRLIVKGNNGKVYRTNIYDRVMGETGRQRMSEKLYNCIYKKFKNATFTVDDNNHVEWSCKLQ